MYSAKELLGIWSSEIKDKPFLALRDVIEMAELNTWCFALPVEARAEIKVEDLVAFVNSILKHRSRQAFAEGEAAAVGYLWIDHQVGQLRTSAVTSRALVSQCFHRPIEEVTVAELCDQYLKMIDDVFIPWGDLVESSIDDVPQESVVDDGVAVAICDLGDYIESEYR